MKVDETEVLELEIEIEVDELEWETENGWESELEATTRHYENVIAKLEADIAELQGMLDSNARMIGKAALLAASQTTRRLTL